MRQIHNRSRLARQENKKLAKQTAIIVVATITFLVLFFWIGIPGLINLAINLGNSKTTSKFQETDTIPPLPPQLNVLPTATNSATIDISGFTEAGATVHLYENSNKIQENTADNQGYFAFFAITMSPGNSIFEAQSIDAAGNQSQKSNPQTVTYNNTPPKLTINQPSDGKRFFGSTEQLIDIEGETDSDSVVFLDERQLVVTGDGKFTAKYELKEGDNQLEFSAVDQAGNKTELTLTINYSR